MPISDNDCCELDTGSYAMCGFEYTPKLEADNGVRILIRRSPSPACTSFTDDVFLSRAVHRRVNETTWTAADPKINIGARPVPLEPMVRAILSIRRSILIDADWR